MRLYGYGRIFVETVSILLLVVLAVVMTGFSKQEAKVQNQKLTLLTARKSVYDSLGKDYPVYLRLKEIMMSGDNHVFRMGTGARRFIKEMEKVLYEKLIRKSGSQTSDNVPNPV